MSRLTYEKLCEILQGVDRVTFTLTRVGEETHSSREVYEAIQELQHYKELEKQGRLIEQKHGKWIPFELDTRGCIEIMHYECSICHEISADETMYCPNCGAKLAELKGE